MQRDLRFAHRLADIADAITLRRFRALDLCVETKPDQTPVSDADRTVEDALRARVVAERKGEDFFGEEMGGATQSNARWIIDPIDGTKNYVRGVPIFATLIAFERENVVELGVVSAPALERRWWAWRGGGAFVDWQPIRVSKIEELEDAALAYTSARTFEERELGPAFASLCRRVSMARGYGDFWQYMLLAEGSVDLCAEAAANLWDLAAVQVIVEEAGGRLTDLAGARRADSGTALASNGLLHDAALAAFSSTHIAG